jgi:hypothetical protein
VAFVDDFKARFPEFDTAQVDALVPTLEGVYPCYTGWTYEGVCGKEIVLQLVAHLFVIETSSGPSNVRTTDSKTVGNVSVSYSGGYQGDSKDWDFFSSTKYGKRYLFLIEGNGGAVFV